MLRPRGRLWLAVKTLAAVGLIAAVGLRFDKLLSADGVADRLASARPDLLAAAGLLYVVAHTIWAAFWVRLLRAVGGHVAWRDGVRAYFVSQFGKYVPGKAWVILLRLALLRHTGLSTTAVAVTAALETLTSMAAGAVLAAALLPWSGIGLPPGLRAGFGLAALAGLPVGAILLVKLAERVVRKHRKPGADPLVSPSPGLLLSGMAQDAVGWACLGLSLGLAVRAVAPESGPDPLADYLSDLAAVALSYVAGFLVVVAPGGLGAREELLQRVLAHRLHPDLGPSAAGLAAGVAVLLRLVWTAFEVAAAAALLWRARPTRGKADTP